MVGILYYIRREKESSKKVRNEGKLLFKIDDEMVSHYNRLLKSSLKTVLIKKSEMENPLAFYRDQQNGGDVYDPLISPSIMQIRPIAAMYLSFPAGSSPSECGFSGTCRNNH